MTSPLAGLKVLDFTTLLPGPYATMLLADMGAEVIRIEALNRPDMLRLLPPMVEAGISAAHATINRNKQSIALDLKQPEAVEICRRLVETHDIVIEQFRPGVMQRLGLDYDTLKAINPALIYCSITGYGQNGPMKDRAGHDINYLALSGLASYSGNRETGPGLHAVQIADIAGGSHHAVMGILAAVIQRQSSGQGQHIDISMLDGAIVLNAMAGAGFLADGRTPEPERELLNGGSFYGYYRTRDDRWFSVGSLEPQFAEGFFRAIGKPEWLSRVADASPEQQQQLRNDIQTRFAKNTFEEWRMVFEPLDLCVEPVLTLSETTCHQHSQARDLIVDVPDCSGKPQAQLACPIQFSSAPLQYERTGVMPGTDTYEALRALGLDQQAIDELIEKGVAGH
ncbi:CaiB/BaiF CoA transferase family protein [Kistimonas asteriae]|uniref:CaiB/BaiF CoA transferase family protein n=1 Tax=Kistimonas asteriae TaxID=517724 RepID=UPI001BAA23B4|nr:CaiB/BaiF CoA-transferase family protein [Kistimonas asteriae]